MDRDEAEESKQVVVLLSYLVLGAISLIFFAIYWCSCRQRGIPGVVLGMANAVQPNTVVVPFQNATGASNVGPPYVVLGSPTNDPGAAYHVAAANPHVGAQYPTTLSNASGAPPSYNQSYQERAEQVPLFK